jgi:hypothetical protein
LTNILRYCINFQSKRFRPENSLQKKMELRRLPKAWRMVAKQQEDFAREAEEKGHAQTAALFYHRAALYYGKAQLYFHEDSPKKKQMHADLVRCNQQLRLVHGF